MFDYISYFRNLAIQHVTLQHTASNVAFTRIQTTAGISINTEFLNKLQNCGTVVLAAQQPAANYNEGTSLTTTYKGYIYLFHRVTINDYDGAETATNTIREIWEDIASRMLHDRDEATVLPHTFRLNGSEQFYDNIADGWICAQYSYDDMQCMGNSYDADKWN